MANATTLNGIARWWDRGGWFVPPLVCAVLVVVTAGTLAYRAEQADKRAKMRCLEAGYPLLQTFGHEADRRYFCMKRVNGTDVMLEVTP